MNGLIVNSLGFIRCNVRNKTEIYKDKGVVLETMTEEEICEENKIMKKAGFIPDYGLDCYVVDGYGAWMGSTNSFNQFVDDYIGLMQKGYDIVLRPNISKTNNITFQIFCKNYHIIYNEASKKVQKEMQKIILMDE